MQVTTQVRLSHMLKRGGMGSVWLAEHKGLQTKVVVKFIDASVDATFAEARVRFSREAAAAAQVKSPHVVQVFDHGATEDGTPYIVMEYLEGRDLESHIKQRGTLSADEVVDIFTQLGRAIEKTHAAGIVHRDLKPGNVFLCDAGDGAVFVKLLDFGIAKETGERLLDAATQTGSMLGSPFYMAPEQIVGAKDIDSRADLWALGVIGFEALTGKRPFEAETIGALALLVHHGELPTPSAHVPALAPHVDAWFLVACARDKSKRYANARALVDALLVALGAEPITRSRLTPTGPVSISTAPTLRADPPQAVSAVTPGVDTNLSMSSKALVPGLPRPRKWLAPAALGALVLGGATIAAIAGFGRTGPAVAPDTSRPARTAAVPPSAVTSPATADLVPSALPSAAPVGGPDAGRLPPFVPSASAGRPMIISGPGGPRPLPSTAPTTNDIY